MHLWEEQASNADLYKIMDELGLPRTKVIFTYSDTKADYLVKARVDIHLDDNADQIFWAQLAGVKCVNVTDTKWAQQFTSMYRAPVFDIKLLICGEGRHGKDTMAELLQEYVGLTSTSSSWVAAGLFFDKYKDVYKYRDVMDC